MQTTSTTDYTLTDDSLSGVALDGSPMAGTIGTVMARMKGRYSRIHDLLDVWIDACERHAVSEFMDTGTSLTECAELAQECERACEALMSELSGCIAQPDALSDVLRALCTYRTDVFEFSRHSAFAEDDGDDKEADRIYGCTLAEHAAAVERSWNHLVACIVSLAAPGSVVGVPAEPASPVVDRVTTQQKHQCLDAYTDLLVQIVQRDNANDPANEVYGTTIEEDESRLAKLRAELEMFMASSK